MYIYILLIKLIEITIKNMDILFTFPLKNPKYCNIKELKKTCTHLSIECENKNKQELITVVNYYYDKFGTTSLQKRIELNFQNKLYYYCTTYDYKSFIKTYDDVTREVYKLTYYNGRLSYIVRYQKNTSEWRIETNSGKKTTLTMPNEELNRWKNIMGYFELYHIFNHLYLLDILPDILYYIITYYKNFLQLPSQSYQIL